jgi:hypothetical protein
MMAELLNTEPASEVAPQLWGLEAKESDYAKALRLDSWTAREAICWLNGRNPIWCRGDINEYFREEVDQVMRAIKAGILTTESSTPIQWIQWAISKGWKNIPIQLIESKQRQLISHEDDGLNVEQLSKKKNERELTRWLRETWYKEGKPGGADFFNALKHYVNKPGSPITDHFTSSQSGAGIQWKIGKNKGPRSKKAIQNLVGRFKKESQ